MAGKESNVLSWAEFLPLHWSLVMKTYEITFLTEQQLFDGEHSRRVYRKFSNREAALKWARKNADGYEFYVTDPS